MALSYPRPWASLLLVDLALLGLLQRSLGTLLPPGLPGLWLEGTLRLGVLWGLLKVGGLLRLVGTFLPLLCLTTPLFFSLRALVGSTMSTSVLRVASASWGWLLAGYVAAALSLAVWAVLSPAGAQEKEPGQENNRALMIRLLRLSKPDLPFLIVAFIFLAMAVWGETLIPHYSGRVIDILGGDFDPDAFASAIFFMCLFSVGSSLSAGCRGGSFLFTMSRINLRIREQLFSSLLRQDLAFFQETKTGELNSRLSSDTSLMSRWLPFNANILLRSLVKVVGLYYFMLQVSPRLTFLSLLDLPLTIAAEKVYNPRHQAVLKEIQDVVAKAGQVVREAVGGLQTVRSFGAEEQEVSRYKEALERCRQLWWRRDLEKELYLVIRRVRWPRQGAGCWVRGCGVQGKGPVEGGSRSQTTDASGISAVQGLGTRSLLSFCPGNGLGHAGADSELRCAADPGWGGHPGRPALLLAVSGGSGAPCPEPGIHVWGYAEQRGCRGKGFFLLGPKAKSAEAWYPGPSQGGGARGISRCLLLVPQSPREACAPGPDVYPASWKGDRVGGTQWVREEHRGRPAAEPVPANRGQGAPGWRAPGPVRSPLPAPPGGSGGAGACAVLRFCQGQYCLWPEEL
ncbi:transporter 2, ATP-binding cassette, sub-family B (MDR/TAP), isoform CRA_b [Rattus norvegicus]|uniref:ABC-type antigen peptide transporter n=1 Tax=Rattus norvegicus TaxID=10116 RepID=A6JJE0_RAT|nr:transporter 2, ATP-binding cassette, sub-family B (MDR/TAP), isoform CRA_b [Rattus norvegicus]